MASSSYSDGKALVDRFVSVINAQPNKSTFYTAAPPSVQVGECRDEKFCGWCIKPYSGTSWVKATELALSIRLPGIRLPGLYRSLVTRYIFPAFSAGGIRLWANTPEGTANGEFRCSHIGFAPLAYDLLTKGYLQFGNPETGDFDPICFDLNSVGSTIDCPILRFEHEFFDVNELMPKAWIYGSFREFLETVISGTSFPSALL